MLEGGCLALTFLELLRTLCLRLNGEGLNNCGIRCVDSVLRVGWCVGLGTVDCVILEKKWIAGARMGVIVHVCCRRGVDEEVGSEGVGIRVWLWWWLVWEEGGDIF